MLIYLLHGLEKVSSSQMDLQSQCKSNQNHKSLCYTCSLFPSSPQPHAVKYWKPDQWHHPAEAYFSSGKNPGQGLGCPDAGAGGTLRVPPGSRCTRARWFPSSATKCQVTAGIRMAPQQRGRTPVLVNGRNTSLGFPAKFRLPLQPIGQNCVV